MSLAGGRQAPLPPGPSVVFRSVLTSIVPWLPRCVLVPALDLVEALLQPVHGPLFFLGGQVLGRGRGSSTALTRRLRRLFQLPDPLLELDQPCVQVRVNLGGSGGI